MSGFILVAYPTLAALGAVASLWLARRRADETEARRARVRVLARRR